MRETSDETSRHAGFVEFRAELDTAVAGLPERYRRPVILFHFEGLSLADTAQALALNANTVGSRLARARQMLRKRLLRRGVAVGSVAALTTLMVAEAGAAVLPATFVSATVKAAGLAAAGTLAAGVTAGTVSADINSLWTTFNRLDADGTLVVQVPQSQGQQGGTEVKWTEVRMKTAEGREEVVRKAAAALGKGARIVTKYVRDAATGERFVWDIKPN